MLTAELVSSAIAQAMQTQHLPPEVLDRTRQEKLRSLLRHAAERSPFYRRLYQGLDPDRVPLYELPVVTKNQIQDHFDEVVTDPRLTLAGVKEFCNQPGADKKLWHLDSFAVLMSSGTSGRRGYYVMDGPALADAIAAGYRQSNRPSPTRHSPPPQRIAAVMLVEPFDSAGMLMRLIPESVGPKKLLDIRQPFDDVCRQLNEFQPTLLSSFPYMLRMLASAQEEGQLKIRPGRITSSGDVLTEGDRAYVRKAFGTQPYDYYCSTEVPYIAWECDGHEGMHVNADYAILESVDSQNRPVPADRLGEKLLLTNLSNRAMPLIRYEMADQVQFRAGPCPCGCRLPRIQKVAGRVEHILSLPGSRGQPVALIPEHIDDFVGGLRGLANYQVIQESAAEVTVNFIPQAGWAGDTVHGAVAAGLERCFQKYNVEPRAVRVQFICVQRLEPLSPSSTKICHYWNRVSRR